MLGKTAIGVVIISTYFAFALILIMGMGYYWSAHLRAPEQPIGFPHPIHAAQIGLPCTFCHSSVEQSPGAGIPSVQKCVNCHQEVATDRPEIQKLLQYWNDKKPIPWIRIHSLPDHVYFTHKRHVKRGFECEQCHGDVKVMKAIRKVRPLTMGWCVTCHRAHDAPLDCWTCHK
jgi:hypothetical protein